MLHLHNGDSTADTLRAAGFPGTHCAFREALTTGATPSGLTADEWFTVRAEALREGSGMSVATIRRDLAAQDAALAQLDGYGEIILWFEHDLFCQTHLIYLLERFARQGTGAARLSLICINAFPGKPNFRGLGELTAAQMASLFDTRHHVTAAEFALAQDVWTAFCSPDPRGLADLLNANTSALPFWRAALLQHLARLPSVRNGLSHAENRLLSLIAEGVHNYVKLCPAFFDAEPAYGLGDLAIQRDLKRMATAQHPLIELTGLDDKPAWHDVSCNLTAIGRQVLAEQADFVELNGIDSWLGGTHLTKNHLWRWDEAQQVLRQ